MSIFTVIVAGALAAIGALAAGAYAEAHRAPDQPGRSQPPLTPDLASSLRSMSSDSASYRAWARPRRGSARSFEPVLQRVRERGELVALIGVAAVLNFWGLSINGWANTYYSAAVRSMSTSWHDFLYASMDKAGLMTVDKPPLSLWVQALSVRVFGFHPLSILIPQALIGVAATVLIYDLTRRRFGRPAGFVAGLVLANTPIVVAVSRHNNPDELLVLCCVAALWFAMRALDTGRTRWLVLSGICVGLGFEAKMGVALMIVPGIAAAYLYCALAAGSRRSASSPPVARRSPSSGSPGRYSSRSRPRRTGPGSRARLTTASGP